MTIQIITELSKDACKRKLLDHMDTRLGAIWYKEAYLVEFLQDILTMAM